MSDYFLSMTYQDTVEHLEKLDAVLVYMLLEEAGYPVSTSWRIHNMNWSMMELLFPGVVDVDGTWFVPVVLSEMDVQRLQKYIGINRQNEQSEESEELFICEHTGAGPMINVTAEGIRIDYANGDYFHMHTIVDHFIDLSRMVHTIREGGEPACPAAQAS